MNHAVPSKDAFLVELFHQQVDMMQTAALSRWRNELGKVLEDWNLALARLLIGELARHSLGEPGQAHLYMARGGLHFKASQLRATIAADLPKRARTIAE